MKNKRRRTIVILSSLLLIFQFVAAVAYGFFDMTTRNENESLSTGYWDFEPQSNNHSFPIEFDLFVQNSIESGYYRYKEIYTQNPSSYSTINVNNITLYDQEWDFKSYSWSYGNSVVGYPQLIDRETNDEGNPLYEINPNYEFYNSYQYFIANDVQNSYTNNQYSLRLNYYMSMTSTEPIEDFTSLSFYAMLGLSDEDEIELRDDTILYVQFSGNGYNWKTVGRVYPEKSYNEVEDFNFYTFYKPNSLKKYDDIYIRLFYAGYPRKTHISGNYFEYQYGRVVIDDFSIISEED